MTAVEPTAFEQPRPIKQADLVLNLRVTFRAAMKEDLSKIEWFGEYAHFRNIYRRTFEDQRRGERLMLVADVNHFPIGHVFIHFNHEQHSSKGRTAYFYSLRVMEMFRNCGIGSRLLSEGERIIRNRRCNRITIAAAKTNPRARALYERYGYRVFMEDSGRWSYVDHHGKRREIYEPSWVLEKNLEID